MKNIAEFVVGECYTSGNRRSIGICKKVDVQRGIVWFDIISDDAFEYRAGSSGYWPFCDALPWEHTPESKPDGFKEDISPNTGSQSDSSVNKLHKLDTTTIIIIKDKQ